MKKNMTTLQDYDYLDRYRYYAWLVVLLNSLFLIYKYVMQVSPSIMTLDLMQTFHISATGLGNLAATFFYSYFITQMFVGILLDKLSPRYLSSAAILTSAIGTYLFAHTHSLTTASLSRCLMGIGSAFATVSYLKLTANWFKPNQFAFVGGLLATAAMVGAIFGQAPLAWLTDYAGWRQSLEICAWLGVAIALLFIVFIRDKPAISNQTNTEKVSKKINLHDVLSILKNKQNWLLTLYSGMAFSPLAVFGGLWGNPFITEAYHLTTTQTATLVSLVFFGLAIGGPALGLLADYFNIRKKVMFYNALLSLVSVTCVIYINQLPLWLLGSLLFLFGFGTGSFMLGFAIGKEINPIFMSATVIALINTGDAISGAFTEPLIGKFLDLAWNGEMVNGTRYFTVADYHLAFALIPAYLTIASILALLIKEK